MGKLNSFQGSIAVFILKCFARIAQALPSKAALALGRFIGDVAARVASRQRWLVLGHLRLAFGCTRSSAQIKAIARDFFRAYGQSLMEILRLPLIARQGYQSVVDVQGREYLDAAMKKGHGCIFLSIHSGNWELSNLVGSMSGYPYSMVANDLNHVNKIADFISDLRRSAGCRIINPGIGGREIIRRLKHNEIVTLVADQGGSDGLPVPFFGRDASMSTGAVRLAFKYDVPILLVNIRRGPDGRHTLVAQPFDLVGTGDLEKDIEENQQRMMRQYEIWIEAHPHEYVWPYKTWKYSRDRVALILDDGRVGHLRQSQAVARAYAAAAAEQGLTVTTQAVTVGFRSRLAAALLPFFSGGTFLYAGADLDVLSRYLEPDTLERLQRLRPDIVISCGARNAAVNWWVARESRARSVSVLPNALLGNRQFDLCVVPQHDTAGARVPANVLVTRGALNLVDKAYLAQNAGGLAEKYPRLRQAARPRIAVLIGGDAQGVVMSEQVMRVVFDQLRSAARGLNVELLITTSRRTPAAVERLVAREFRDDERTALLIIANEANVPEAVGGMLALADVVVVSGESVSMVSEAATSGKPAVVFPVADVKGQKYDSFCAMLAEQGHVLYVPPEGLAAAIDSAVKNRDVTRPLNDNTALAEKLRKIVR